MPSHPHPSLLRRLLPFGPGALANARAGIAADELAAGLRHEQALARARSLGTASWAPRAPGGPAGPAAHAVHVTTDDADLLARLAAFVEEGLADGEVCVVIATDHHAAGLRHLLALAGLTGAAREQLVLHDAEDLLARLLREGRPDPDRFEEHVAAPLRALTASGRPVRAFGEMVGLLALAGDRAGGLELEQLWNGLLLELALPLLCAYPPLDDERFLEQVHGAHSHVVTGVG